MTNKLDGESKFTDRLLSKTDRSDYLIDIYLDLAKYLKKLHPSIEISKDIDDLTRYNPFSGSIVEDFKNVIHLKMLRRIPDLGGVIDNSTSIIADIFKKHGLEEPSFFMINKISSDLREIISMRLGENKNQNPGVPS